MLCKSLLIRLHQHYLSDCSGCLLLVKQLRPGRITYSAESGSHCPGGYQQYLAAVLPQCGKLSGKEGYGFAV
ncbi:hypothetical protein D3C76_1833790 [compost metagenome]